MDHELAPPAELTPGHFAPRLRALFDRQSAEIRASDFSRDLLERVPERLRVSILTDLERPDLGPPERVLAAVRASGAMPPWSGPGLAEHSS